jgi:hypothetical protein
LGEGTKAGIFQSIMAKPPNVQPVYPVREEFSSNNTVLTLQNIPARKGPVIIFNPELSDPRSLLGL